MSPSQYGGYDPRLVTDWVQVRIPKFERGRIIGLKEAGVGQIGESLVMWVEAMWPLEDAGKNGWTVTDFRVTMVAVDLEPQQIRRID
ncbi:hypothetical protein TNCV_407481 [Trichonephila clavipes]|nr:hypothetical protein TNCV_407481 [Trichonephila clavipes]